MRRGHMKKPNILDRAIMTMAPVHAAKRAAARVALSVIKSGYGSYGTNLTKKSMRGWMYHGGSAKEDIEDNIDILQQRSRDAYMGIPTATAALKTMRTNVVAGGLMPAPQLDSDYLGLDETAVEKLQAQFVLEFALWADTPVCDAERMDNFYQLQQLAFLSYLMNGDTIAPVSYTHLQLCAPAPVYAILLSDVIGDPPDMIASGPAYPDSTTTAQAMALVSRYGLTLSPQALDLLEQEPPKMLDNVTTVITGSVAQLCRDAAARAEALGYRTCLLTDRLQCEAREAGRFLSAMAGTHAGKGEKTAYILGGETVVHLTGHGLGGRNQELALAAAEGLAGLEAVVASVGSDGTDGPTDVAGGITDGTTADALAALGISIDQTLADNDAYHALKACAGLIVTGPTGTNVNDIPVLLV